MQSTARGVDAYLPEELDAHRNRLRGLRLGKGCIRYPHPGIMDFDIIPQLLAPTRQSTTRIC